MELCSHGHDEVCYDGNYCPVCDLIERLQSMEIDNSKLEDEIESLKDEIDSLKEIKLITKNF